MYNKTVASHFAEPRNVGRLESPDCVGRAGHVGQGPYMVLELRTDQHRIVEARFQTYGCPAAIACGSYLASTVEGMSFERAGELTAEDIGQGLGGLPLGKEHCPPLAIEALQNALIQLRHSTDGSI